MFLDTAATAKEVAKQYRRFVNGRRLDCDQRTG